MSDFIDQSRDLSGRETHRLTTLYAMPEFVKSASQPQLCGPPSASGVLGVATLDHLYGDPEKNLFPCHTKAATFLSTVFFMDQRLGMNDEYAAMVESRLNKSAAYFSIVPEVREIKAKMASDMFNDIAKLPNSDFAYVCGNERHLPLRNAGEVKAAADWFAKYRDQFKFHDRQKVASRLLAKATEIGASLGDHVEMLEKTAGHGMCSAAAMLTLLENRAMLIKRAYPELAAQLDVLRRSVAERNEQAREQDFREKVATAIDDLDRLTHLNREYANGLPRAEEVLFELNEKVASDIKNDFVSLTTGNIYEKAAFAKLDLPTVQEWMGREFAQDVSAGGLLLDVEKMAAAVSSLSHSDAQMLDKLLAHVDITPYAKEAQHAGPLLSREKLLEFAQLYQPTN